jgi:hypothetical protein
VTRLGVTLARFAVLTLATLWATEATQAAETASTPAREQVIADILDASGDREALPRVTAAVGDGLASALTGIVDPREAERIVSQSITADRVYRLVVAGVAQAFDATHASRLLDRLRTPFAQRVTRLELKGSEASEDDVAAYSAGLEGGASDAARARLLERLEAATLATEATVQIVLAIQRGIERAAAPSPAPPARPQDPAPRVLLETARVQVTARQRYTYRELTNDELAAYVSVLEEDSLRWFARVMRTSLSDAIEAVCEDAARRALAAARRRVPEQRL